ncbi:MAG: hypothetical protein LBT00_12910 [Spirochaetaceae bacterium]|nr:hypothetical protein [Spirochaetaceae bacterium]
MTKNNGAGPSLRARGNTVAVGEAIQTGNASTIEHSEKKCEKSSKKRPKMKISLDKPRKSGDTMNVGLLPAQYWALPVYEHGQNG